MQIQQASKRQLQIYNETVIYSFHPNYGGTGPLIGFTGQILGLSGDLTDHNLPVCTAGLAAQVYKTRLV
ncbi:hypothetical protein Dfri01_39280 [Dyadobacter frigoris]|nr:hypothetical protein Dfri01_39280 [Dyadobacter frigoris]